MTRFWESKILLSRTLILISRLRKLSAFHEFYFNAKWEKYFLFWEHWFLIFCQILNELNVYITINKRNRKIKIKCFNNSI